MSTPVKTPLVEAEAIGAISSIYDPEIPVNIYGLGLIYDIEVGGQGRVAVRMTLTAPGCPSARCCPSRSSSACARCRA